MKPFEYIAADSLETALQNLDDAGEIRIMAGGTDLIHEMKNGVRSPSRILNIRGIPGLSEIAKDGDVLTLGALVAVDRVEKDPLVRDTAPILATAAGEAASPQLRVMGTVVGNILQRPRCWFYRDPEVPCLRKGGRRCHAIEGDNRYHAILGGGPCHIVCPSDLAPALVALGASVTIVRRGAPSKTVALTDFFVGPRHDAHNENKLQPGEIVTEIRVPVPGKGSRGIFIKARERKVWDFALASVAAQLRFGEGGRVAEAAIVLGGVAPNPWVASDAAASLVGEALTDARCVSAADLALAAARPLRDNAYKVDLTRNLVARALRSLIPE